MENLNEALKDLRTTIAEDGFTDTLVEEIANDWDIKPALLARKFEEKTGKSPAEFKAVSQTALRNIAIEIAMKAVVEYRARFTSNDNVPEITGKGFTHDGEDYIAVCIATGGLRAVKVSNGKDWKFGTSVKDAYVVARHFNLI